jgi:5'-methylthioadenosine phosphorylase
MSIAIIAGTDIYDIPGVSLEPTTVETRYGVVHLYAGAGEHEGLYFLPRHGPAHTVPPHRVNYRANMKALAQLDVVAALAVYAVGSINPDIPPGGLALLDDMMDFTSGRENTFFDGGASGLVHTIMSPPYCPTLRQALLQNADSFALSLRPTATYVCTNGPRFETPGEIRAYARLGADVVGMTGAQEMTLARELGIHFAGVAISINWAAGIESTIHIIQEGMDEVRMRLLSLFIHTLRKMNTFDCLCEQSRLVTHPPEI